MARKKVLKCCGSFVLKSKTPAIAKWKKNKKTRRMTYERAIADEEMAFMMIFNSGIQLSNLNRRRILKTRRSTKDGKGEEEVTRGSKERGGCCWPKLTEVLLDGESRSKGRNPGDQNECDVVLIPSLLKVALPRGIVRNDLADDVHRKEDLKKDLDDT